MRVWLEVEEEKTQSYSRRQYQNILSCGREGREEPVVSVILDFDKDKEHGYGGVKGTD